jgi:hypothetical protein
MIAEIDGAIPTDLRRSAGRREHRGHGGPCQEFELHNLSPLIALSCGQSTQHFLYQGPLIA